MRHFLSIIECFSTVAATPFELLRLDTGCTDAQIVEAVAWAVEHGIGAYTEDNCVVVARDDRETLDLICAENRRKGWKWKRKAACSA